MLFLNCWLDSYVLQSIKTAVRFWKILFMCAFSQGLVPMVHILIQSYSEYNYYDNCEARALILFKNATVVFILPSILHHDHT